MPDIADLVPLDPADRERLARLSARTLPAWRGRPSLGLMLHWTPASIPAWAPTGRDIAQVVADDPDQSAVHSPYAEWYWNALRIPGSPTAAHHAEHHAGVAYEDFVSQFLDAAEAVDIGVWIDLAREIGAGHLVLVAKHHDGVLLWPSSTPNPHRRKWRTRRDLVAQTAAAAREAGLRFGIYYSGGLDWTFDPGPSRNLLETLATVPTDEVYHRYALAHLRELVERHRPDILWNDIAFPAQAGLLELFDGLYDANPHAVINDRWLPMRETRAAAAAQPTLLAELVREVRATRRGPPPLHSDFATPEYAMGQGLRGAWECVRGVGTSFGYNRAETTADLLSPEALGRLAGEIGAAGGSLLLNVAIMPDGRPCPMQREIAVKSHAAEAIARR